MDECTVGNGVCRSWVVILLDPSPSDISGYEVQQMLRHNKISATAFCLLRGFLSLHFLISIFYCNDDMTGVPGKLMLRRRKDGAEGREPFLTWTCVSIHYRAGSIPPVRNQMTQIMTINSYAQRLLSTCEIQMN